MVLASQNRIFSDNLGHYGFVERLIFPDEGVAEQRVFTGFDGPGNLLPVGRSQGLLRTLKQLLFLGVDVSFVGLDVGIQQSAEIHPREYRVTLDLFNVIQYTGAILGDLGVFGGDLVNCPTGFRHAVPQQFKDLFLAGVVMDIGVVDEVLHGLGEELIIDVLTLCQKRGLSGKLLQ